MHILNKDLGWGMEKISISQNKNLSLNRAERNKRV
jgi:hypothetical protein